MTASFQHKAEPMRVHLRVDTYIGPTNPGSQIGLGEPCISRARIRNALISHENFFARVFRARILLTAAGGDAAVIQ